MNFSREKSVLFFLKNDICDNNKRNLVQIFWSKFGLRIAVQNSKIFDFNLRNEKG